MPDEPITFFDPVKLVLPEDIFPDVQADVTMRCTADQLRNFTSPFGDLVTPQVLIGGQQLTPVDLFAAGLYDFAGSFLTVTFDTDVLALVVASWDFCRTYYQANDGINTAATGYLKVTRTGDAPQFHYGGRADFDGRNYLTGTGAAPFIGFNVSYSYLLPLAAGEYTFGIGGARDSVVCKIQANAGALGSSAWSLLAILPVIALGKVRITEAGAWRLTEDGKVRITEGRT